MTIDLANPEFEPSDEQLKELSRRAFRGVRERHQQALRLLQEQIEEERKRVMARFKSDPLPPRST